MAGCLNSGLKLHFILQKNAATLNPKEYFRVTLESSSINFQQTPLLYLKGTLINFVFRAECTEPDICRNCGGEGHLANDCTEEAKTRVVKVCLRYLTLLC